jgi:hypothetical protein
MSLKRNIGTRMTLNGQIVTDDYYILSIKSVTLRLLCAIGVLIYYDHD